ncbi:MAG: hypothetical protein ACLU37_10260 [Collinsella sp.]
MSQNTTTAQPRTVQTADRGKLDVRALVLLAILLAAGFILNFTVGKAISGISGGMISPSSLSRPSASLSWLCAPTSVRRSLSA